MFGKISNFLIPVFTVAVFTVGGIFFLAATVACLFSDQPGIARLITASICLAHVGVIIAGMLAFISVWKGTSSPQKKTEKNEPWKPFVKA